LLISDILTILQIKLPILSFGLLRN